MHHFNGSEEIPMDELREKYAAMSDSYIKEFAVSEVQDLTLAALAVFTEELKRRNVDETIIYHATKQQAMDDDELDLLSDLYSRTLCPICKQNCGIDAIEVRRVTSFILTFTSLDLTIGCRDCLRNEMEAANGYSIVCGWWGIYGIFLTPIALFGNYRKFKKLKDGMISEVFKKFVNDNRCFVLNKIIPTKLPPSTRKILGNILPGAQKYN